MALALLLAAPLAWSDERRFSTHGFTTYGEWDAELTASPDVWNPGDTVRVSATLRVTAGHIDHFANDRVKVDGFCMLVTAERTFDADGWMRFPSDDRMSTLLTPTGLPIEGGVQGAVTTRFGGPFRTPLDQFVRLPMSAARAQDGWVEVSFQAGQKLPDDLPPGIYRLRFDFGFTSGTRNISLQNKTFASRHAAVNNVRVESHVFSPPLPASGTNIVGRRVFGPDIQPRLAWVLLNSYNSNGYRGVVAEEDRRRFGISGRNIIQDDVILPLYDAAGRVVSYSLEPQFPGDTIEPRSAIPWNYRSGAITVEVTAPDGKVTDLGTIPFVAQSGQWPTTRNAAVTAWKPSGYGLHEVRLRGWIADVWGNIYRGGGTYRFWIANRMTMATATFQGQSYPVGNRYGRDIGFAPAVPADVGVTASLYPYSDPDRVRTMTWSGKASPSGVYGAAQGAGNLPFDEPGEYAAQILAKHTDQKGNLWVCSMRHAGVVYPPDSPIVARGKKLYVKGKFLDRGDTMAEGWADASTGLNSLQHLNFPWNSGDVLLIASEGQGANKIEPVMTWEAKDDPAPYASRLNAIGASNLQMKTSNGYAPHLYPEYITDRAYYYASGPRPGFMGRFIVGEDGAFQPYWPLSPNSFGGQINATSNGDLPGDIYRLLGGVVLRRQGEEPRYAGYLASAFILPGGTGNNRVIAPGSEDLPGPSGRTARFFLVGTRPGMMYQTGATFGPAVQIDPILPAELRFTLHCPDGRVLSTSGRGDASGGWAGARWVLDKPGVYRYNLEAEWEGHRGVMPGLPPEGGEIYVVESDKPAGAPEIRFDLPVESTFNAAATLRITGTSTAESIRYAAVIPGAVIGQGSIEVKDGKFEWWFDPREANQRIRTYDVAHRVTGKPELGDVIHLTFFSREKDGAHSFARIIIRGSKVIAAR